MHPNDVLIQASSTTPPQEDVWHVIHRSAGQMASQAWIEALRVARRIARQEKVDIYRADADSTPTLFETYRPQ